MMKNDIKTAALVGYINIIATILVGLVYTPVLIRLMGQSEYGLYSLAISIVSYLSVLDMGFGNAMIRYVSKFKAQKKIEKENKLNGLFLIVYSIIGIISFVLGVFLIITLNSFLGNSLSSEELNKAKIIMIIMILNISISFPLSVYNSYAMALEKFTFLRILSIIKTIAVPLVMLPLLYCGYKAITMVIITSVFNIFNNIYVMIYDYKKLNIKFSFSFEYEDKILFKEIVSYSFFIFLNIIVDTIFNNTDQIIIGSILGTVAVSVYAVATKISQINTNVSATISGLFLPKITKLLEDKDGEKIVSNLFLKVSRIQMYIMGYILSLFLIIGKKFIIFWAGKEYVDAYYICLLLMGPAIIPLTQNICISIIQAKNKHRFRSSVYIFIAILNVLITIPLTKKYGVIGASVATAISVILGQIITMNFYYYKIIKIDIKSYWKNFISFSIPVGIMCCIFKFVDFIFTSNSILYFILTIIVYSFIYMLWCLVFMNKEEKEYIYSIFKKFLLFNKR